MTFSTCNLNSSKKWIHLISHAYWLQNCNANHASLERALFTNECSCSSNNMFNEQSVRSWACRNPHAMVERSNQGRSTIDVWARIFGNRIIGLVYLPTPIKCATYSQLWHIVNSVSLIFSSATQSLVFAAVKWLRAGQTPLHRRGWELLKLLQFLSERTLKSRSIVSSRLSILTTKRKICCTEKEFNLGLWGQGQIAFFFFFLQISDISIFFLQISIDPEAYNYATNYAGFETYFFFF